MKHERIREALLQAMMESPAFADDAVAIAREHGEVLVTIRRDGTVEISDPRNANRPPPSRSHGS